jgi:hypothetical protein
MIRQRRHNQKNQVHRQIHFVLLALLNTNGAPQKIKTFCLNFRILKSASFGPLYVNDRGSPQQIRWQRFKMIGCVPQAAQFCHRLASFRLALRHASGE